MVFQCRTVKARGDRAHIGFDPQEKARISNHMLMPKQWQPIEILHLSVLDVKSWPGREKSVCWVKKCALSMWLRNS